MDKELLLKIVDKLGWVLDKMQKSDIENERKDSKLRARYAEYYVASKLSDIYKVNIKSGFRGADIILDNKIKIEVKSGEYNENGGEFSFGKGAQISDLSEIDPYFNYCVCVAFPESGGSKIIETLIFTLENLQEIKKPRGKNLVRNISTNSCILIRNYTKVSYYKDSKGERIHEEDVRQVELDIIKHPSKYVNRWDKIARARV
jgi:hypothetical protein